MRSRLIIIIACLAILSLPCFGISGSLDEASGQRRDGSMLFDVYFTIADFSDCVDVRLMAVTQSGESLLVATFVDPSDTGTICEPGDYHIIWDVGTDLPNREFYSDSVIVLMSVAKSGLIPGFCECPDTVVDIDGNIYATVEIGNQCWMAENLKTIHYQDGTPIINITENTEWSVADETETAAYCEYANNPAHVEVYGRLYNWYAVDNPGGLCPEGWRVPSDDDWKELEIYLGMSEYASDSTSYRGTDEGSQIADGYDLWLNGALRNSPAFNTSGLNVLPNGYRSGNGFFYNMNRNALLWSYTESDAANAWARTLQYTNTEIHRGSGTKRYGMNVRCIMMD